MYCVCRGQVSGLAQLDRLYELRCWCDLRAGYRPWSLVSGRGPLQHVSPRDDKRCAVRWLQGWDELPSRFNGGDAMQPRDLRARGVARGVRSLPTRVLSRRGGRDSV